MKIAVINGSPAGKNSITLQTVLYIEKFFPACTFEILHAGQTIKSIEKDFRESERMLKEADLLLFCYPVYTFLAPAQLHRFLELIKEHRIDLSGKYATQLTTSKHFYDTTAHQFIQDNCDDLNLQYIRGLSADMEDLLKEEGQKEALQFFRYVLWCMEHHFAEPRNYPPAVLSSDDTGTREPISRASQPDPSVKQKPLLSESDSEKASAKTSSEKTGRIVVVTDTSVSDDSDAGEGMPLPEMIRHFSAVSTRPVSLVDLAEFPFAGGCLGCFHCASDGTCIYKDGFDAYLRSHIQSADAIVYAFTVKDHSMGYRFKLYDDRQFCNGHRTVTMGKPVGYLVKGSLEKEPNLKTLLEARAQVGGNFLAGIVTTPPQNTDTDKSGRTDPDIMQQTMQAVQQLAEVLAYAIDHEYQPPKNFYGVGGLKIFRDLIYQMQGLMKEDHRFYKQHGFYDFPQKHKGRIAAMYLVGAMMTSQKLRKKAGGKMTEGMLMPYQKILKDTGKR